MDKRREMARTVRFQFEEHLDDGYDPESRIYDACQILEEIAGEAINPDNPPAEAIEMAREMGEMYEHAIAKYRAVWTDLLNSIGPPMPA